MVQGLYLLQRTPTLPAPAGDRGHVGRRNAGAWRVVGVGDSIMAGTGVRQQCHSLTATYARLLHERSSRDVEWRVVGRNGATSHVVLHELAPAAPAADVYVISCGVNDATHGVTATRFRSNLATLFERLRAKAPRCIVLYGGLPPLECFPSLPWPLKPVLAARARALQVVAQEVIARHEHVHGFEFPTSMPVDRFASDGFHPAEAACEQWAQGLLDLCTPQDDAARCSRW